MQPAALGVVALVNRICTELECIIRNGPLTTSYTHVLHAKELQASLNALLSLSEQTQWHLVSGKPGTRSLHAVAPYDACWQHVVDTQLLKLIAVVLELLRVPRVALDKAGDDKIVPEAIQVGPLHESLLRTCALFIAGVRSEAAPLHLHRQVLEHLMVPSQSGFLLLVADSLTALVQCAANHPRLLAEPEGSQQHQQQAAAVLPSSRQKGDALATTPQRYDAAAPQQLLQKSSTASSSLGSHPLSACLAPTCFATDCNSSNNTMPGATRRTAGDASFVAYARSAAHEVSLAAQEHRIHCHLHQPHPIANSPLTKLGTHQQAPLPELHILGPAADAGRTSGWLGASQGANVHLELFLKRGPHGSVTAGVWQEGRGSEAALPPPQQHQQQQQEQQQQLERPDLQPESHISRCGALCVLGILRDLNGIVGLEAAAPRDHTNKEQLRASERETKEALSRLLGNANWTQPAMADVDRVLGGSAAARERSALQADQMGDDMVMGRASVADALVKMRGKSLAGGRNGVLGSASTALEELGASMLDVRAVLAGLLSEMKLLGQLVDMHRNAELAGCTKEDNLPYLEVITAIVASFNSPDLATSHSKQRNTSTYTDPRLFSAVLEPAVIELTLEELCNVANSAFQIMEGFPDTPVAHLPRELQGHLHLLHKLVASLVILSAAPLPPAARTLVPSCSTTLSPSMKSMQRQPWTPMASPATVRASNSPTKPVFSAPPHPTPSSAATPSSLFRFTPSVFSPFRQNPTPPAAPATPRRAPLHSAPTPLGVRPFAHTPASSRPDSAHLLANSQNQAALQRAHSHATPPGFNNISHGSHVAANTLASKRSQLLEAAHPDVTPFTDDNLQGLQGGGSIELQGEMGPGDSPTQEAVSLPDVVTALVLSGRVFAGFASCDIHFFNKTTSTLMHTLKAVTKRLAVEGLEEHVESIAVGLSQVLCSMTRAMGAAAQAAVQEDAHDQERQQEELQEWERQRAKETWKAGGAQRSLLSLKPNQVLWSYVGRPHGWGAGANKGLGDTPLPRDPLTNNAWRLTNKGSFHVPISSFNVRPPSSTSSVSDQSQPVSRPSSAKSLASHRSPRDGSTTAASATPRLERLSEVDQDENVPEKQIKSNETANATGLDAFWDALGYDADGNPLPKKANEANGLGGLRIGPRPWPGPSTHVIAHFEELLCDILSTLLHLVRGYLLPVRWKPRMKSAVRTSLALNLFQGTYVNPLPEENLLGSVPPSVASLWDGLARAGLLTSLELLFELEMLEDELYVDATAGWGAKSGKVKGSKGNGKGAEFLQIDRVRVLSARLIADLLVSWPAAALEVQGAYLLRAVRKFLNVRVRHTPRATQSAHILSTAASGASRSVLHHADLSRATSSTAGFESMLGASGASRSPKHTHGRMGGAEELRIGALRGSAAGAGSRLTAYTINSVVALAQELLPLTQMVIARAATNTTTSPLVVGAWTSNEATSRAGILVLMHTWPPLMHAIGALLSVATLPTDDNDMEAAEGAAMAAAAAAAAAATKGGRGTQPKQDASSPDSAASPLSLGPRANPASPAQATASQAAATAAAATAAAAAAKSTADAWKGKEPRSRNMTRQGTSLAFQGLRSVHLVERVRCIAPLQRLFQNWVQQLYQLLVKYSHMEALQTALELVVLHGGFLELVDSILKGTHYTLAVRGLHASALGQGSVLPDNAISRADSVASSQASEWMMGWQQEQLLPNQQAQLLQKQRDVDRNYGISGVPLLGFEELLCLLYKLIRPHFAPHLAASGTLARVHTVVLQLHARNAMRVSMAQALAAAGLLKPLKGSDPNARGDSCVTSGRDSSPEKTGSGIGPGSRSGSRPSSARRLRSGNSMELRMFTSRHDPLRGESKSSSVKRSSQGYDGDAANLPRTTSNSSSSSPQSSRPGSVVSQGCGASASWDPTLRRSRMGRQSSIMGPFAQAEGGADAPFSSLERSSPFAPASPNYDARSRDQTASRDLPVPGHKARSNYNTWRASQTGVTDDDAMGSSFDTKKDQFEGWQAALEGDKVLPRLNYWVLLSCSCIKRCCVAGALRAARLAEERLTIQSATSAVMERYTLLPPTSISNPGTPSGSAAAAESHGKGSLDASPVATVGVAPGGVTSMRTATATATEKVLEESSQASLLHQHTRTLLIACKSSGVQEAQLLGPLANVPHLLAPALQLRTMPTSLSPMTPEAVAITRAAGMEIAAAAVVQGTTSKGACASEPPPPFSPAQSAPSSTAHATGKRAAHPNSLASATGPAVLKPSPLSRPFTPDKAPTDTGPAKAALAGDPAQQQPSTKPSGLAPLHIPSNPTQPSPAPTPTPAPNASQHHGHRTGSAASSCSTSDAHEGSLLPAALGRKPPPRLELPPGSPLAPPYPSPGTLHPWGKPASPHAQERQQQLGLAMQPWECNASVLCVGEPATRLWLQPDNLERQVKQAQLVLDGLLEASRVLSTLPTPQMPSIVSVEYRPFLLGCCNMECSSHVPGRTEKEVHLHRCEECNWVSYCSLECKQADQERHQGFCEWQSHLHALE
mmetsp:Transcript_8772/g.23568  ORF Transcript_8772/g.23568 Transcript_8772/m.23568 type:complete len:2529 (+) Transcript_8772:256-7842(+)